MEQGGTPFVFRTNVRPFGDKVFNRVADKGFRDILVHPHPAVHEHGVPVFHDKRIGSRVATALPTKTCFQHIFLAQ